MLSKLKKMFADLADNELLNVNINLVFSWLTAVSLFSFVFYFGEMNQQILPGVTEAREHIVNFKEAVLIDEIIIQSGQFVRKGEPLFILSRPDLKLRESENDANIRQTAVEMNILNNKNLDIFQWHSFINDKKIANKTLSPLELNFLSFYETDLYLKNERRSLKVLSPVDGFAGEINFNVGETVAPFTKIISLFQAQSSIVKSFIPESYNLAELNQNRSSVVKSMTRDLQIRGEIISIATILSELPERFQKDPMNKLFGREIKIALPMDNGLYLGEKVFVTLEGI